MAWATPDTSHEDPARFAPCGLNGTLAERTEDCRRVNPAQSTEVKVEGQRGGSYRWQLVMSESDDKGRARETWFDHSTGLQWGPRLELTLNYEQALTACPKGFLPSSEDYMEAEAHGLRSVLTDLHHRRYWTSTPSPYETAAYFYNGTEGYVDDGSRNVRHSVRCVTQD